MIKGIKELKTQIKEELIVNLFEQVYNKKLDIYGLAILGLFSLEEDLINRIVADEIKQKLFGGKDD